MKMKLCARNFKSFSRELLAVIILCFATFIFSQDCSAGEKYQDGVFQFDGKTLNVKTDRYEMSFHNGAMVLLKNLLTGENYTPESANSANTRYDSLPLGLGTMAGIDKDWREVVVSMHQWQWMYKTPPPWPFQHHPCEQSEVTCKPVEDSRGKSVTVTWQGLKAYSPNRFMSEESFSLKLTVISAGGDLEILGTAKSNEKGVYGCGIMMANLSASLNYIIPLYSGFSMKPSEEPPFTLDAHWPYPWVTSLIVLESQKGSAALYMADPEMRDRFLHMRSDKNVCDIVYEGINHAPFEDLTVAESRPVRINVYKGNWIPAATAFRDWWATTFKVKSIKERSPDFLDKICWMNKWPSIPPEDIADHAIDFVPQIWKVRPNIGDHGLFPFDMSKGPELGDLKKERIEQFKAMKCEPYVYVNISHFCRAHPWAEKFWPYRRSAPFRDPRIEEDPRFGAGNSFYINCAYKPWQDLILDWTVEANKRFGIKGFYMDCAAGEANSLGGLIDGKNNVQGEIEIMRRQKEAIPGCFLGVEYLTEAVGVVTDFAGIGYDSWFKIDEGMFYRLIPWRKKHAHPLIGFLYNKYVHLMYFNVPTEPCFELVLGRVPLTSFPKYSQDTILEYCEPENFAPSFARLRSETEMRPDYPEQWEDGVRMYYADPAGNRYRVLDDAGGSIRFQKEGKDGKKDNLYLCITGVNTAELAEGKGIDGWIAYDGAKVIGLNPAMTYEYFAKPRIEDWEIVSLPPDTYIDVCRPFKSGRLVLNLKTLDDKPHSGTIELRTTYPVVEAFNSNGVAKLENLGEKGGRKAFKVEVQAPGIVAFDSRLADNVSLEAKAADSAATDKVKESLPSFSLTGDTKARKLFPGVSYALIGKLGLRVPIPIHQQASLENNANGILITPSRDQSCYLDYILKLPAAEAGKKLLLKSDAGTRFGNATASYDLFANVNGKEVFRESRKQKTGTAEITVDLTPYASQAVLLTVGADKGTGNLMYKNLRIEMK